jgi:hypothetical protein
VGIRWTRSQIQTGTNSCVNQLRASTPYNGLDFVNTHGYISSAITLKSCAALGIDSVTVSLQNFRTPKSQHQGPHANVFARISLLPNISWYLTMSELLFPICPACLPAQFHCSVVATHPSGPHCKKIGEGSLSCTTMVSQSVQHRARYFRREKRAPRYY